MPNEGPYGGRIEVRHDKGKPIIVTWQAAGRVFYGAQESLGSLEFAVRIVNSENDTALSRDRKCLVRIKNAPASKDVIARVLIVSGYDQPAGSSTHRVLGQGYFVTASVFDPAAVSLEGEQPFPFVYDAELHYDDYDLNRLGITGELDDSKLSLCYVQWKKTTILSPINQPGVAAAKQPDAKTIRNRFKTLETELEAAAVQQRFEEAAQIQTEIQRLRAATGLTLTSYWEQQWKRVKERSASGAATGNQATNTGVVLTEPIVVSAKHIQLTPGSRSVKAFEISQPAHLGLMYHG